MRGSSPIIAVIASSAFVAPIAGGQNPVRRDVDWSAVEQALGRAGAPQPGGVMRVSFPRAERITEEGREVPPSMGVATAINFQPTGSARAATPGDFVITTREVN